MITKYELGLIAEKLSEENFCESDAASAGEITSVVSLSPILCNRPQASELA